MVVSTIEIGGQRDAIANHIYSGINEIQQNVIVSMLL
jgi:hypothetical protein